MSSPSSDSSSSTSATYPRAEPDAVYKAKLDGPTYYVTRQRGTERAWTSPLNAEKRAGTFKCVCCGEPLFVSDHKFESGCGWPSFHTAFNKSAVEELPDYSHGMVRTEIRCKACGSHLGHVFDGERTKTGLRYCVNGVSLVFEPAAGKVE